MTITFGSIAVNKSTAKKQADRPLLNDYDPEAEKLATEIFRLSDLTDSLELLKKELASRAKAFGLHHFAGRTLGDKDSLSVSARTADGNEVVISMNNRYSPAEDTDEIERLMGDAFTQFMRDSFAVKIDGDKLPMTPVPAEILPGVAWPDADEVGKPVAQVIIDRIGSVLAEFNCADAVSVKQGRVPSAAFHRERLTRFDEETNVAIDRVMPMVVAVKPVKTK
jgi:hypothetical protein